MGMMELQCPWEINRHSIHQKSSFRTGGMAQLVEGTEFKPQYCQQKKKKLEMNCKGQEINVVGSN
jgi:hypothetical protein